MLFNHPDTILLPPLLSPLLLQVGQLAAERTAASGSACLIVDLVSADAAPMPDLAAMLAQRRTDGAATYLRIGLHPMDDDMFLRLVALQPDGFVLAGCGNAADIQQLDVALRVAEAECGLSDGGLTIMGEAGLDPGFFLDATMPTPLSRRLKALIFNGADLAKATGIRPARPTDARLPPVYAHSRGVTVLAAAACALPCYDLADDADLPDAVVKAWRDTSHGDGFVGLIARNGAQLSALYDRELTVPDA